MEKTDSNNRLDIIRDKMKQEASDYEAQNSDKIPFSKIMKRTKVQLHIVEQEAQLPSIEDLYFQTRHGNLYWQWVDMKMHGLEKHYLYETYYDFAYIQLRALERMDPYGGQKITYTVQFHPVHGRDIQATTSKHQFEKLLSMIHNNSKKVLEKYHSISA